MIGQSNVDGPAWASSQLAELEIAEPFVTMEINRTAMEQGQEATIFCKLNQLTPFEGEATAELLGVPPHIEIPNLKFNSETKELNFNVKTNEKSRVGKHKGLFCRVTITKNDEKVVSTAARSELQINKPKPKPRQNNVVKTEKPSPQKAKPKPKSRLQQLRESAQSKSNQ